MKTIFSAFLNAKGTIHREFVRRKQIVNDEFYKEEIKRLIARVHRVRSQFQVSGSCLSSARQCTGAFFGRYLRVFGGMRDPRVIQSILLP
jgi:hypothetical protein